MLAVLFSFRLTMDLIKRVPNNESAWNFLKGYFTFYFFHVNLWYTLRKTEAFLVNRCANSQHLQLLLFKILAIIDMNRIGSWESRNIKYSCPKHGIHKKLETTREYLYVSNNFWKHNDTFQFVEHVSMFQTSSSAIQGIILIVYK